MSGYDAGLLCAALLSVVVLWSCAARLRQLSLIDAFAIGLALYFGAYTIVDYFAAEQQAMDAEIVAVVFLGFAISAFIFWGFSVYGPRWVARETSLQRLEKDWLEIPGASVLAILAIALAFRVYTAVELGSYGDMSKDDLSEVTSSMPYWFTSLVIITPAVIYAGGLMAWGKLLAGSHRLLWLAAVGVSLLMVLGSGRRSLIAFVVIVGLSLLKIAMARRRAWLAFGLVALSFPALLVVSNVFQIYRAMSYQGVPIANVIDFDEPTSMIEGALEAERTVSNLADRQAMWLHNYEVMEAYANDRGRLQYGTLLLNEITNYIPAALWPGKEIFEVETTALRAFGLEEVDHPNSVWSFSVAEFGYLGIVTAPALIIAFVLVVAFVLRNVRDPFMRAMVMGFFLYYALNIEVGGLMVPVQIWRDLLIVAVIYFGVRWMLVSAHRVVLSATARTAH